VIIREKQLAFDFTGALDAHRMDGPESPMPDRMRKVDFWVEEEERVLLVEVKDPSDTRTTVKNREDFIPGLKSGRLVNESLVPKCRDTYTYLHLMQQDSKPLLYVVLLSLYEHIPRPEVFGPLQARLAARLKKEAKRPWARQYVTGCIVVNMAGWNAVFPYRVTRSSDDADSGH